MVVKTIFIHVKWLRECGLIYDIGVTVNCKLCDAPPGRTWLDLGCSVDDLKSLPFGRAHGKLWLEAPLICSPVSSPSAEIYRRFQCCLRPMNILEEFVIEVTRSRGHPDSAELTPHPHGCKFETDEGSIIVNYSYEVCNRIRGTCNSFQRNLQCMAYMCC